MKSASSSKWSASARRTAYRRKKCPHCAELLGFETVHICPVGCCYVAAGRQSFEFVCPYCDNTFETGAGHVCLELIKLTEPAQ
ncbi:MAG: hypothetical protein HY260_08225 [Chloroflexi bacterium]|nr:hypothetical protein [Chloroflexota bacterium]